MSGNLKLASAGGGSVTVTTPSTASNLTLTLPSATGTVATIAGTETLTNKTLVASGSNTVEATSGPTSTQLAGMRNKIINGAMMIDQRNAGASVSTTVTGTQTYTLDRWAYQCSAASKFTVQQNAGSVTPPAGFTNYLGVTSTSAYSAGASDYFAVQQRIEGYNLADLSWGTASAATVTLSFWVRSSLTGTFGGSIRNDNGRYYLFSYTIASANTWTQITLTITGDTSGTWNSTNGASAQIWFGLGVGSSFSGSAGAWGTTNLIAPTGAQSVVGTNGATWYVTGVQLEKGATATPFENRQYGTELALCMRYYEKSYNVGAAPGSSTAVGFLSTGSVSDGSNNAKTPVRFAVAKRAAPTVTGYKYDTGASGSWDYARSGASGAASPSFDTIGENGCRVNMLVGAAWAACTFEGQWTASAEL